MKDELEYLIGEFDSDLKNIMSHWDMSCVDNLYGGYLTCRNRDFTLYDDKKGAWAQARHIYTYSLMAEHDKKNSEYWLSLARVGIYFIFNKMMPESSLRVNYLVSRDGKILDGPISVFSDAFAILGLAKYIQVCGDRYYLHLLEDMFLEYSKNILDPDFKDIAPNVYEKGVYHHALLMISVNVAYEVSFVLGGSHVTDFMKHCMDTILYVLVDKTTGCILEKMNHDGTPVASADALFLNVGHVFESLWFCLDCATKLCEDTYIKKIIHIAEAVYQSGTHNGLVEFSRMLNSSSAKHSTWKFEIAFEPGDRVSWAYAESMVLFLYLYKYTEDLKWFERFLLHKKYVAEHFIDYKYGDWYHALNNEGEVKIDMKGSTVKDAFHIPRALVKMISILKMLDGDNY